MKSVSIEEIINWCWKKDEIQEFGRDIQTYQIQERCAAKKENQDYNTKYTFL